MQRHLSYYTYLLSGPNLQPAEHNNSTQPHPTLAADRSAPCCGPGKNPVPLAHLLHDHLVLRARYHAAPDQGYQYYLRERGEEDSESVLGGEFGGAFVESWEAGVSGQLHGQCWEGGH
jgi:hypothetical protein